MIGRVARALAKFTIHKEEKLARERTYLNLLFTDGQQLFSMVCTEDRDLFNSAWQDEQSRRVHQCVNSTLKKLLVYKRKSDYYSRMTGMLQSSSMEISLEILRLK